MDKIEEIIPNIKKIIEEEIKIVDVDWHFESKKFL